MSALSQLPIRLGRSFTRRLIWLETAEDTAEADLTELLTQLAYSLQQTCLLSERKLAGLTPVLRGQFVRHLGSSYACVVMDAFSGLNPSAVAQAAGTVVGGGVLILLTPPASEWLSYPDPEYAYLGAPHEPEGLFLHWFVSHLESHRAVYRVRRPVEIESGDLVHQPEFQGVYLGDDQRTVVERLLVLWRGQSSCVQLNADRGRGKSSALGLALALQSSFDLSSVVITAPDKRALSTLNQAYQRLQPNSAQLRFCTPAQLLTNPQSLQCLIIDEAAALPVPVLEQLCQLAPHTVLSSTQHGYEGFGRGYGLRFLGKLQRHRSDFVRLELQAPLRWAAGDPLEAWVDEVLLLNAETPAVRMPEGISEIERRELVQNSGWLNAVYALLAQAHYRTSPSDLRLLLDSDAQRLLINVQQGELVGVVWVAEEGPIEMALAQQIAQGRRRPSGNLLPQSLIYYQGWLEASQQRFWRVVRIAVVAGHRRRGLGQSMLDHLYRLAREQGADFVGASFAGHKDIIQFWQHAGYQVVRQGETVDPVAAAPAVQVLQPLNEPAGAWLRLYSECENSLHNSNIETLFKLNYKDLKQLRDRRALENFALHFAPLSLVRQQLIRQHAELDDPLIDELLDSEEPLSASQIKVLRTRVAASLKGL